MSHKAIVAQITALHPIPKKDRILLATVLGENVVVGADSKVGDIGLFFQADLQLSEEYCRINNLHRHSHLNVDMTKSGFFDDNRRVRTQTFAGVRSEAYFTSLESLAYTGVDITSFKLMDSFDELNGNKLCEKYISEQSRKAMNREGKVGTPKTKFNVAPDFAKHVDTDQFKHYVGFIEKGALLSFHAKKHGTSFRVSYLKEYNILPKWKKTINKYLPLFPEYEWKHMVGTRNVLLNDPEKEGFHGKEQYRYDVLDQLTPYLEKGMVIYGEIVGYVNGSPIMPPHSVESLKNKEYTKKYGKEVVYKYGCNESEFKFHIYRIAYVNEDGKMLDFTDTQVNAWCEARNIRGPQEVHPPIIYDGDQDKLVALVEQLTERPEVLTEDYEDSSSISEGIIIRWDRKNLIPKFYKNKSFAFKCMEGICTAVDEEAIS